MTYCASILFTNLACTKLLSIRSIHSTICYSFTMLTLHTTDLVLHSDFLTLYSARNKSLSPLCSPHTSSLVQLSHDSGQPLYTVLWVSGSGLSLALTLSFSAFPSCGPQWLSARPSSASVENLTRCCVSGKPSSSRTKRSSEGKKDSLASSYSG